MPKTIKQTTKEIDKKSQVLALEMPSPESLNVLITRPKDKAQELAHLLNKHGISNTSQPLFSYQPLAKLDEIATALKSADIAIFVSVAAVNFAHETFPLTDSLPKKVFAIGQATKQALANLGIDNIFTPATGKEHSEGLLNLPELSNIVNKNVLIFRGNGGREHLGNTLTERSAQVSYIESYQRVWHSLEKTCAERWRTQQINCIVITSNDILLTMYKHLKQATQTADAIDEYWQFQCLWVVVSERLEKNAKALGLTHVINARGASSKTLCDTLQALPCS